jgi:hypothetical protein
VKFFASLAFEIRNLKKNILFFSNYIFESPSCKNPPKKKKRKEKKGKEKRCRLHHRLKETKKNKG